VKKRVERTGEEEGGTGSGWGQQFMITFFQLYCAEHGVYCSGLLSTCTII
jgi:hypothetical protein